MDSALQTMINNLPEKTGKSLSDWHKVLASQGLSKHGEMVKYLKTEHGVTHGFANTIVALYLDAGSSSKDDPIANQYAQKPQLYKIYKQLDKYIKSLGKDIEVAPKKNSVSYIQGRQFALIQPTTKTRIDLGLKIKDQTPTGKLETSGPFGTMCTHRIQLTKDSDIDQEVKDWIKTAYNKTK